MDLLLFGIQGSGKGTQAGYLYEKYKFLRFGTGHELREIVRSGTSERAEHIRKVMQEGRLVSDHIIFDLLEEYLSKVENSTAPIIFDGIPRNPHQLEMFEHIMKEKGRSFQGVYFDISVTEALKRIKSRKECSQCGHPQVVEPGIQAVCDKCTGSLVSRSDDENVQVIMNRFQNFFSSTFPVITSLFVQDKIAMIDAAIEPQAVFAQLDLLLQQYHYSKNED